VQVKYPVCNAARTVVDAGGVTGFASTALAVVRNVPVGGAMV
jgi:hypothetical protein